MRYWKEWFGNSHGVLYEVMCALLICASGSSGLHDKQDLKVLTKSGSEVINFANEVFFIYKTNVRTHNVRDKTILPPTCFGGHPPSSESKHKFI